MGGHHNHDHDSLEIDVDIYERCMSHVELIGADQMDHINPDTIETDPSAIFIKNVPPKFQKQFSYICAHFQEIKDTNISLRFRPISMTMQARPNIWTVLGGEREYFVFVNTERNKNGLLLEDIPFNAQIGIIAHELCHIIDYHYKTNWEIIKTGLWYLKKRNQEHYEKAVDYLVIKKGFGHQLRDWSHFVLNHDSLTDKYKKTKETYYLDPDEIDHCVTMARE